MKIALISLDQKWEDKIHNQRRCDGLSGRAAELGAEMVVFPEMTLTGFTMNTQLVAEPADASPSLRELAALAKKHGVWVVAGVVLRDADKAANTLVVFSPKGEERTRYIKMHPFSFAGENRHFTPGRTVAKTRISEFQYGFSICYDLRFPELYSVLAKDCEVLINIANWPRRRVNHWRTLLQARAIENQVYMIGVNRTGVDANGLEYERSSMIIDANGDLLVPTTTDGEIDIYDVNLRALEAFRHGFSTRQDRMPEIYRALI